MRASRPSCAVISDASASLDDAYDEPSEDNFDDDDDEFERGEENCGSSGSSAKANLQGRQRISSKDWIETQMNEEGKEEPLILF